MDRRRQLLSHNTTSGKPAFYRLTRIGVTDRSRDVIIASLKEIAQSMSDRSP
ncbi:MAG: hypothetical protein ACREIG_04160 [Nitrospiraceae bacterium]